MSLKPVAPKNHRPGRVPARTGAPIIIQKKESGSGGLIMGLVLLAALAGGAFLYYNQQQNEATLAAQQQRLEDNARAEAENARLRAEYEAQKQQKKEERAADTAMGAAATPAAAPAPAAKASSPAAASAATTAPAAQEEEEEGPKSAMGSTSVPSAGDGVFNVEDTSAPVFDLTAKGKAAQKVIAALDKAIDKAGDGDSFHDLQADLKRSFEVAQPGLFADPATLPSFPDKEQKLLRMAHGVYVCLNLASELDSRNTVPSSAHARFVNWLMKDKAKAARTFTYGVVEHCGIHDSATAADLLDEVRQAYLISPTSGMKKIPAILKAKARN